VTSVQLDADQEKRWGGVVGHRGTTVTELVFRHQLRPVLQTGATVIDRLFGADGGCP
jgi:hypothetical protein